MWNLPFSLHLASFTSCLYRMAEFCLINLIELIVGVCYNELSIYDGEYLLIEGTLLLSLILDSGLSLGGIDGRTSIYAP